MGNVHEEFNHPDADIVIQSSDGVQFHLHRKNLESTTGAFPGPEFDSRGEVVHLTESANVLGLLFKFVYPMEYPDLEALNIVVLLPLAEAAEKYEVRPAMHLCSFALRTFAKDGSVATKVLLYALEHSYPRLADEAAPHLVFSNAVLSKLPSDRIAAWIRYREATRKSIHEAARNHLDSAFDTQHGVGCVPTLPGYTPVISPACYISLVKWFWKLEKIESLEKLMTTVETHSEWPSGNLSCPCLRDGKPIFLKGFVRTYTDNIKSTKKLSAFL